MLTVPYIHLPHDVKEYALFSLNILNPPKFQIIPEIIVLNLCVEDSNILDIL